MTIFKNSVSRTAVSVRMNRYFLSAMLLFRLISSAKYQCGWWAIVMVLWQLPTAGWAQTIPVLAQKVQLSERTATIESVLKELGVKAGLSFAYSTSQVDLATQVQMSAAPQTVQAVLDFLAARAGFTYLLRRNQVVLRQRPAEPPQKYTISGYVREKGSQELLIGVSIYIPALQAGVTTNNYGFYSLTLPVTDTIEFHISLLGYKPLTGRLPFRKDAVLTLLLEPQVQVLNETVISANQIEQVSQTPQTSIVRVSPEQIQQIPSLLGEKDVMKVFQLMPGVQKGREGMSNLYVRGGGSDQNLIILDDATVYNTSHGFGFLSLFNGDALKSVSLAKGGFPARFGGRLSSVLEMDMKEGSKEKLHGRGGLGLVSSRLTLEGPLQKDKSSFLISGRRSYIDLFTRPIIGWGYSMLDLSTKVNTEWGKKNKLFLSGYFGQDRFSIKGKSVGFRWGNATGTCRWNHQFTDKLFANLSLILSDYRFEYFYGDEFFIDKYKVTQTSKIRDWSLKYDVDFFLNPQHTFKFGLVSTYHYFRPNDLIIEDALFSRYTREGTSIRAVESGIYVQDRYRVRDKLTLDLGWRLSNLMTLKKQYWRWEPRLAALYQLKDDLAIKASYAQMSQYIHLISNTGTSLPTDQWVPATPGVPPQRNWQAAIGLAKDWSEKSLAFTAEGYYKQASNVLGYREGANFLAFDEPEAAGRTSWEDNVISGQGWSYGMELLLQKQQGRFLGWIGYTLAWSSQQFDLLNQGKKFYASYDRRHDLSVTASYQLKRNITLSGNWVFGSGVPIMAPRAVYQIIDYRITGNPGSTYSRNAIDYGERNTVRAPAYHRFDLCVQFHKHKKWGERTWEINIYNLYNRLNPLLYYSSFTNALGSGFINNGIKSVVLFPILPSVSYHFKF